MTTSVLAKAQQHGAAASRQQPLAATLTAAIAMAFTPPAHAQEKQLSEVVVSASRSEQTRFDAPAAINAVVIDPMQTAMPMVNLSELVQTVPGLQARDRQNFAQDLQISVRGFGTRSTFGVRGVRILVDGIPATMPDGQGQAATASLSSASRIEILRGPLAQLYGNAAGGVVQVFTRDPLDSPPLTATVGAGSDNQRQLGASLAGGSKALSGLIDVSRFSTDGYRDHSAAERTQVNAKVLARPSDATTFTAVYNNFSQPLSQDPLGLTRANFYRNPRSVDPVALTFDTRKTIDQQQLGLLMDHKLNDTDTINARIYGGTRQVFQTLALNGAATSGGVVDLDRTYGGVGLSWNRKTRVNGMPLNWTVGVEADRLKERRRGFVNNSGTPGALRRDEDDSADNLDYFGQMDWTVHPDWRLIAGVRSTRVKLSVKDYFGPDDSGSVDYRNTSPVLGTVWHATDNLNVYANIGQGFETPTLAEAAYGPSFLAPNLSLRASKSQQAEIGAKYRNGRHALEVAAFIARSSNEIVPSATASGRTTYQNVDGVERRGMELGWQADWRPWTTRLAYTLVDGRFTQSYTSNGAVVAAGNRLPGVPQHALSADVQLRSANAVTTALEMRFESRTWVNDQNSEAAPGFAVFNLRSSKEFRAGPMRLTLFGRIDNLLDKLYAGSIIVNDGNGRYYEPAAGRRLFVGLRTAL